MSDPRRLAPCLGVALLLCSATAAQSSITWATTLERALEFAADRGTLVLVSVRAPGERGSDRLAEVHDKDRRIAQLAAETVNAQVVVEAAADRSPDEAMLRARFLELTADGPLATPLHLLIDPAEGGRVVSSAAGALTPGELEWLLTDALSRHRKDFRFEPADRTRAPASVRFGSVDARVGELPPDDEAVAAAIDALKRGGRGMGALEHYRTVLRSESPAALKFGNTELRRFDGFFGRAALEIVGELSPLAWADFAIERLDHRDDGTRESAARALQSMACDDARRPLVKALQAEKTPAVRGRLLRAAAACGPTDTGVLRAVERALADRDPAIRVQATMALGVLEADGAVAAGVERALADDLADVRAAAAWVIASRREPDLRELLDRARNRETDAEVTEWLDLAAQVVDTPAPLGKFETFAREKGGDRSAQDPRAAFGRGRRGGEGAEPGEPESGGAEGEPGRGRGEPGAGRGGSREGGRPGGSGGNAGNGGGRRDR